MPAALSNDNLVTFYFVNNTVYIVNTSALITLLIAFQQLWFADAGKGLSIDILQNAVDAFHGFLVMCLPIQIILPRIICPCFLHPQSSINSWIVTLPASASAIERASRS